ncbi:MAG: PQQ-binding-like beta-propeller repeat protein, partial [Verrucomicrobiales bacterium]|nr:PQQ-binding-like beta-propeller repeat protein [Verrucomicrobiales bacterium]
MRIRSFVFFAFLAVSLRAADWPTWRQDAARSGFVEASLPTEMRLAWSRFLGIPDPAFDYHFRLCADWGPEPVARDGRLFVPSNTRDSVTAFDLKSGGKLWEFVTEGPLRFAPVALEDRVVFGSDDGHLYCVDPKTGALKWKVSGVAEDRADHRMLVNGRMSSRWPVRGAPVEENGTIFFGCGIWPAEGVFLVAVDAATGSVKWRNGEISQIDDGLEEHGRMADVGLPPHGYLAMLAGKVAMPSGRALAAFADPATGKLDPYNSYYAKTQPAPRGMWAICGGKDFWFQGGALMGTNPDSLDALPQGPVTVEVYAALAGQPVSWVEDKIRRKFLQVTEQDGQRLVMADPRSPETALNIKPTGNTAAQLFQLESRPVVNMLRLNTRHEVGDRGQPVFAGDILYRSEFENPEAIAVERGMTRMAPPQYDRLRAYDLTQGHWKIDVMPSKRMGHTQRWLEFPVLWELPVKGLVVKIVAGNRLYAAGDRRIVAIDLPPPGGEPKVAWEQKVHGQPVGVIAADDRLVVTTTTGRLYVFSADAPREPPPLLASERIAGERHPEWRAFFAKRRGSFGKLGYALVLGWNSGQLAEELSIQTKLGVIVVEPNPEIAKQARQRLAALDWPAQRVQVIEGESTALKLPPYFAQVVASENVNGLDNGARLWTRTAVDVLRPFSGVALLSLRPKLLEQARAHAEEGGGYTFETTDRWTTIRRVAAPRGAEDWTHEEAGAANTFASTDTLAKPPFGLLWYSGEIDRQFSPEFEFHHNRNPYPVICGGRMFMLEGNRLHAADVYTGQHLWMTEVPESAKAERRLADHRTTSRATDQNLIATPDTVYVFGETNAQRINAASGEIQKPLTLPPPFKADTVWDEARIQGDLIYIAAGAQVIALDRKSGALRWQFDPGQQHAAFSLGGDQLYAIGYSTQRGQDPGKAGAFETKVQALNAATGEPYWNAPLSAPGRPEQSERSAGKPSWAGIFQDNPLKPTVHYNAAHQ